MKNDHKAPTRAELLSVVKGTVDGGDEEIGLFLLASVFEGTSADRICRRYRINRQAGRTWAKRCRENGIWEGRKICAEWASEDERIGVLSFAMDVLVVKGLLMRNWRP